jgi:hypothetical protein
MRDETLLSFGSKNLQGEKRNHEDDEAGDAGNDNRGSSVHADSQSVMGCR